MQNFRKVFFVLGMFMIVLTSATIAPTTTQTVPPSRITAVSSAIEKANADSKITSKELRNIMEVAKGEKLTLKEKIGLKFFGKKISSKLSASTAAGKDGGNKSQLTALLLCIFLGGLGIHRFYLGYTWQGVVQLLTGGGCGIWALIDLVRIIIGDLKPKGGEYAKTL